MTAETARAACERLMAASGLPRVVVRMRPVAGADGRETEAFVVYEGGHFMFRFGDGTGTMASRRAAELMAHALGAGLPPDPSSRRPGPKSWAGY